MAQSNQDTTPSSDVSPTSSSTPPGHKAPNNGGPNGGTSGERDARDGASEGTAPSDSSSGLVHPHGLGQGTQSPGSGESPSSNGHGVSAPRNARAGSPPSDGPAIRGDNNGHGGTRTSGDWVAVPPKDPASDRAVLPSRREVPLTPTVGPRMPATLALALRHADLPFTYVGPGTWTSTPPPAGPRSRGMGLPEIANAAAAELLVTPSPFLDHADEVRRLFRELRASSARLLYGIGDMSQLTGAAPRTLGDDLPVFRTVFGKWAPQILATLDRNPTLGFEALRRELVGISPRILSRKLRNLEEQKMITRTTLGSHPPQVRYALTDRGWTFLWMVQPAFLYLRHTDTELLSGAPSTGRPTSGTAVEGRGLASGKALALPSKTHRSSRRK
jgi:DNA-binding HxlR family transcriptional regulator